MGLRAWKTLGLPSTYLQFSAAHGWCPPSLPFALAIALVPAPALALTPAPAPAPCPAPAPLVGTFAIYVSFPFRWSCSRRFWIGVRFPSWFIFV